MKLAAAFIGLAALSLSFHVGYVHGVFGLKHAIFEELLRRRIVTLTTRISEMERWPSDVAPRGGCITHEHE